MDIIFIRDLKIDTVVGIYDWERRIRQTVILDIEMAADIRAAAKSDSIEDTVNYKAVSKRLIQFVQDSEYQLVETLAEECARIIREEFNVSWVRLRLNKTGALRGARDVGILIERGTLRRGRDFRRGRQAVRQPDRRPQDAGREPGILPADQHPLRVPGRDSLSAKEWPRPG